MTNDKFSITNSQFRLLALVVPLLLRVSASLREKSNPTENGQKPTKSLKPPFHEPLTIHEGHFPVIPSQIRSKQKPVRPNHARSSSFKVPSSPIKPNQGIFPNRHARHSTLPGPPQSSSFCLLHFRSALLTMAPVENWNFDT